MAHLHRRHGAADVPQFGFYKVGSGVDDLLTIIEVSDLNAAKRAAWAAIEAEGLDAVRLWANGQRTIEVCRPARPARVAPTQTDDRGARMAARKAEGATWRAIGEEFGVSKERVRDIIAMSQSRARLHAQQPNRAALSVRARNAIPHIIVEPETDAAERDKLLPGRVAALTRRQIGKVPNLGKQTIVELEAWLWQRGLTFDE